MRQQSCGGRMVKRGLKVAPLLLTCTLAMSGCGEGPSPSTDLEQSEENLSQATPFVTQALHTTSGDSHDSIPLVAYGPDGSRVTAFLYNGTKGFGGMLPTFGRNGTGGNLALGKFAADGSISWSKGFSPGDPSADIYLDPQALTVDGSGNIILAGQLSRPASLGGALLQPGWFLAKFSPTGEHLLSRNTRAEPGTIMQIRDLQPSPDGDIYALADYYKSNKVRPMVVRYAGATLEGRWTQIFGQPDQGVIGRKLAVDGVNRAYLTGFFRETLTLGSRTLQADPRGNGFLLALNLDGGVRWARPIGVWGDVTDVSSRDGHLVVAASGQPDSSDPTGGYLLSFDLSGTQRFAVRVGALSPWSTKLGPLKEVAVLSADDSWVSSPGGSNLPFYLSLYDRVTGALIERRSLLESRPVWDPGSLAIDPQTGSVSLGAIGSGEVNSGPHPATVDGDAFFLEYRH